MKYSFDIKIPSKKVQAAMDDLDGGNQKDKTEMDMFIDDETASMSLVMRKFSGRKVRFTIETI